MVASFYKTGGNPLSSRAQLMEIIQTGRSFLCALEQFAVTAKFQDEGEDIFVNENYKGEDAASTASSTVVSVINELQRTVEESLNSPVGGEDKFQSSSSINNNSTEEQNIEGPASVTDTSITGSVMTTGASNETSMVTGPIGTTATTANKSTVSIAYASTADEVAATTTDVSHFNGAGTAITATSTTEEEEEERDDEFAVGPLGIFGEPIGSKKPQLSTIIAAESNINENTAATGGTSPPEPYHFAQQEFLDKATSSNDDEGGAPGVTSTLETSSSSSSGKQWISLPENDEKASSFSSSSGLGGLVVGFPGDKSVILNNHQQQQPQQQPQQPAAAGGLPGGLGQTEFNISSSSLTSPPAPAAVAAPAAPAPVIRDVSKMTLAEIQALQRRNAAANAANRSMGRGYPTAAQRRAAAAGGRGVQGKPSSSGAGGGQLQPADGVGADPQPKHHTGFLRMRGLPFRATKVDITKFFAEHNVVFDSIVLTYYNDGRATGEAFLGFQTPNDSRRAMECLNRRSMGNRYIELFIATKEEHGRAWARFTYR